MSVRQLIPEGLAEVAPGPELARVLAGLELSRLSGFDCVEDDVLSLMDLVAAIHHIAARVQTEAYALERDNAAVIDRLSPDSRWRVEDVVAHTGLSVRSVQERARELGGVKRGRRWQFDPDTVRSWQQRRLLQRDAL